MQVATASGVRDAAHLKKLLKGFNAGSIRPQGSKIERALPFVNAVGRGGIKLFNAPWNSRFLNFVEQFPHSGKDVIDACSGAIDYFENHYPPPIVPGVVGGERDIYRALDAWNGLL